MKHTGKVYVATNSYACGEFLFVSGSLEDAKAGFEEHEETKLTMTWSEDEQKYSLMRFDGYCVGFIEPHLVTLEETS